MKRTKNLGLIAATSIIGVALSSTSVSFAGGAEKCYCVAKAGQNDCANNAHNCSGKAAKDFDCSEWKYVASGTCADVGGSITPK